MAMTQLIEAPPPGDRAYPSYQSIMKVRLNSPPDDVIVEFGRFHVLIRDREIFADGTPLRVGARAFDLLLALIEANGRLVSKNELMARVWPSTTVSEDNLKAQVCGLRKALGADRDIVPNDIGRGYRFIATVRPTRVRARGRRHASATLRTNLTA